MTDQRRKMTRKGDDDRPEKENDDRPEKENDDK